MSLPTAPATSAGGCRHRFDRPIFIISTPRSGSTLLFETLQQAPGLFTTGSESHGRIESIPGLSPADHGWHSNRLGAEAATADVVERLALSFLQSLRDRDGKLPEGQVRMLEKTPKNALRIPFFDAAWPDALFVYLYRDFRETFASMCEAWLSGRFRTYVRLPGWQGPAWSLLLVPGWQDLIGRPLPEIVAHQWAITTNQILDDLQALSEQRVKVVDYREFLSAPQPVVERLAHSLDLEWDHCLGQKLPLSKTTVSRPGQEKWRRIESIIEGVWPIVEPVDERAKAYFCRMRQTWPS